METHLEIYFNFLQFYCHLFALFLSPKVSRDRLINSAEEAIFNGVPQIIVHIQTVRHPVSPHV